MASSVLTNLINMVYTETARPDLVAETLQAIFEATLSAHMSDDYYADTVMAQTAFAVADYVQTLDTTTIPLFRKAAFFRKAVPGPTLFQPCEGSTVDPLLPDPVTGAYVFPRTEYNFLEQVAPNDIIDDFGFEKQDIWYQVGTSIQIRSSTSISNGQFGWYQYPSLDIANGGNAYFSWIANTLPFVIVYKAAGTVLQKTGQADAVATYMNPNTGLYFGQLALLKMQGITPFAR